MSPSTAGQNRGPSVTGPILPGQLVDPAGSRARAHVAQEFSSILLDIDQSVSHPGCWSTLWALGPGPESPSSGGRGHGASATRTSHPGELVDTAGPPAHAQFLRDSWSTTQALGHGPELPGTDVQPHRPWEQSPSPPGVLVKPAGNQAWVQLARESRSTLRVSDPSLSRPGRLVTPEGPQTQA